ncbi:MAG: hypothetical protein P1Q69_20875, partial [Candidatus Thorarchaeota archaeon]|nr:hypothetical protein [Candidatus Thorarchaeota archaeon]
GRQPLINHLQTLDHKQQSTAVIELGSLATEGYIQRTTLEQSLIQMAWCILEKYASICREHVDSKEFGRIFQDIIKENVLGHPWLGRIRLLDIGRIYLDLDYSMTPTDFDQMYEDIELMTQNLDNECKKRNWFRHPLLRKLGAQASGKSLYLEDVTKQCHAIWRRYISDATL